MILTIFETARNSYRDKNSILFNAAQIYQIIWIFEITDFCSYFIWK